MFGKLCQVLLIVWGALAALSGLVLHADGHAVMIHPPSRNWNAYLLKGFNYPHGLAAGGELETLTAVEEVCCMACRANIRS
jgi:hypothetical protein